jgi:hypothetical protein
MIIITTINRLITLNVSNTILAITIISINSIILPLNIITVRETAERAEGGKCKQVKPVVREKMKADDLKK